MEPFETELIVSINEDWFMLYFEKIIKRHVKNPEKIELILIDIRCLLREANEF